MADRLNRLLNFKRGELPLALLSAAFFFCLLCGYFFLRPVRDAMGVSRGMDELRWLFVVTSISALVFVVAFGGIVSRLNRRRFIPIAYFFIIVCLLIFASLLVFDGATGGGLIGSDAQTSTSRIVGYTFYVWLSVINLFATSIFWAFMVDIFDVDQGKRLFPFIGIGGTLGGLAGGFATRQIAGMTDSVFLPAGLMLSGATLFAVAILIMLALDRAAARSRHSKLGTPASMEETRSGVRAKIGGKAMDGLVAVFKSPYLLGIGGYIVMMAISNTMIYFTQANLVLNESDNFSEFISNFALFDVLAQTATLVTQIFVTTHLIRKLGVGFTLAILPLVTTAGFAVLAVWPTLGVMAIFQALHRATRYAVSRPARETLFSVVPASEKYKAKPIIDVFLYRGGDVAGAGIDGLFRTLGLSLSWLAAAIVPIAGAWGVLSFALGRTQGHKAGLLQNAADDPDEEGKTDVQT